ncbi:hypothetical protein D3C76_1165950 [compost metagenome]
MSFRGFFAQVLGALAAVDRGKLLEQKGLGAAVRGTPVAGQVEAFQLHAGAFQVLVAHVLPFGFSLGQVQVDFTHGERQPLDHHLRQVFRRQPVGRLEFGQLKVRPETVVGYCAIHQGGRLTAKTHVLTSSVGCYGIDAGVTALGGWHRAFTSAGPRWGG